MEPLNKFEVLAQQSRQDRPGEVDVARRVMQRIEAAEEPRFSRFALPFAAVGVFAFAAQAVVLLTAIPAIRAFYDPLTLFIIAACR